MLMSFTLPYFGESAMLCRFACSWGPEKTETIIQYDVFYRVPSFYTVAALIHIDD